MAQAWLASLYSFFPPAKQSRFGPVRQEHHLAPEFICRGSIYVEKEHFDIYTVYTIHKHLCCSTLSSGHLPFYWEENGCTPMQSCPESQMPPSRKDEASKRRPTAPRPLTPKTRVFWGHRPGESVEYLQGKNGDASEDQSPTQLSWANLVIGISGGSGLETTNPDS